MADNGATYTSADFAEQINGILANIPILDDEAAAKVDREVAAVISRLANGMSPLQLIGAYSDWIGHLAASPGRRQQLRQSLANKLMELGVMVAGQIAMKDEAPTVPLKERAFSGEAWQRPPFNLLAHAYETAKEWVDEATRGINGIDSHSQELVRFINEQIIEAISPANFPFTNPEVLDATREEKGQNLVRGMELFRRDMEKQVSGDETPEMGNFKVGKNIGITPGKVIFQNDLIELIQYSPATEKVAKEPVLIVPAWIMKYYILDLSPRNSLARYLVEQGKTVFMISWKNPTGEHKEICLDDYLKSGLFAAIKAVKAIVPRTKINAVGYCIGGTLLAMGAATMARDDDNSLNSVTLLAAQTDFTEPGEIKCFLGASQLAHLDAHMWTDGYLSSSHMSGAFMALRSRDLVWNPAVQRYFLGRESSPNDLMAWNADGTRMPYTMHRRYLQELFIENRLAECRYEVDGKPISLLDIRVPLFVVGTTTDHVAPWKSVYKINRLTNTEISFLLTSGGHNAGIVSGPSHPRRRYQMATRAQGDKYIDPDTWMKETEVHEGSWWPAWHEWLHGHSTTQVNPPAMGAAKKGYKVLRDAPGEYVFE